MDHQLLKMLCEVAQKASHAKQHLKVLLENNPKEYMEAREYLNDIQEVIAKYCDCAPIDLISANIEKIMQNLEVNYDQR